MDAINPDETAAIRLNLQRQQALGNDRFRAAIEAARQARRTRCPDRKTAKGKSNLGKFTLPPVFG